MTKEELKKLSNEVFFDNNEGLISPDGHRRYNDTLIGAMAMDVDLTLQTERINTVEKIATAHTKATVVDEVVKNTGISWCRSNNHVSYVSLKSDAEFKRLPIGEVCYYYGRENGRTKRDTSKTRYFGVAVQVDVPQDYFEVRMAGIYHLLELRRTSVVVTSIDVTQEQANAGHKIYFNDGVLDDPAQVYTRRTYARLYYLSNPEYLNVTCRIGSNRAFRYSTDFTNKSPKGVVLGVAVEEIETHDPVMDRKGRIVEHKTSECDIPSMRKAFMCDLVSSIDINTFLDVQISDADRFTVEFKKSKTVIVKRGKGMNARITKRVVGYAVVKNRSVSVLREQRAKLTLPPSHAGNAPYFIDFRIWSNYGAKTVIAKYRGTYMSNKTSGGDIEYGLFMRRI